MTRSPSQRVKDYLEAEFSHPSVKGGTRLPTIRDLASHLSVSAATVNAVFRELAREGHIRTRGKAGTFLVAAPRKPADHLRIAVGAPLGEDATSDAWISPIGLGVFRAAVQADAPVTLLGQALALGRPTGLHRGRTADADVAGAAIPERGDARRRAKMSEPRWAAGGRRSVGASPSGTRPWKNFPRIGKGAPTCTCKSTSWRH